MIHIRTKVKVRRRRPTTFVEKSTNFRRNYKRKSKCKRPVRNKQKRKLRIKTINKTNKTSTKAKTATLYVSKDRWATVEINHERTTMIRSQATDDGAKRFDDCTNSNVDDTRLENAIEQSLKFLKN